MILLVQRWFVSNPEDHTTGVWEDINVPNKSGPPRRGVKAVVQTVEEFAAELIAAGLEGVYRAVTDDGVFKVRITRVDKYEAKIEREGPNA